MKKQPKLNKWGRPRQSKKQRRKAVNEVRLLVYERDGYKCHRCGCKVMRGGKKTRKGMPLATIDHYLPKSAGGSDEIENLKTCCQTCNNRKGAKIPKELRTPSS